MPRKKHGRTAIAIYLLDEDARRLRRLANRGNRSVAGVCRRLIEEAVQVAEMSEPVPVEKQRDALPRSVFLEVPGLRVDLRTDGQRAAS